uniref:COesterase domain-containing protein n=1 Tax=Panagrellus redivivus TaxID=6233 RepID=A0A7E4VXK4_PANRE
MAALDPTIPHIEYDRSKSVQVSTNYGPIKGFIHTTDTGIKANVFLGVPYAKPPVGELRFEHPEPPTPWTEPLETKYPKKPCVPYTKSWLKKTFEDVSEDCLYLNVIAPVDTDIPHPVLMYIHGGGFCFGDCIRAGFDKYVKNFVSRGIVVVSITYRVGLYGFFSTGDAVAEGNYGLWDQLAGLKWVHENIAKLGGDPNNVTLWGQSAGAASVDALALAPVSRDYVHKVVQASGSAFNDFATAAPNVVSSKNVAKALGCTSDDSAEIKNFLKKQSTKDIIEAGSNIDISNRDDPNYFWFGPRIDNAFFGGKSIETLISETPPKPTLFGLMANEGIGFVVFRATQEQIKNYKKEDFLSGVDAMVPKHLVGSETNALRHELTNFYLKKHGNSPEYFVERHSRLISDVMFDAGVLHEMEVKQKQKWPVYFYIWKHINPKSAKIIGTDGACHSYDLWFTSDQKTFAFDEHGPEELKIREYYAEMLSNFAKTGNPSTEQFEFPAFTPDQRQALWILPEPRIDKDGFVGVKKFFDGLEEKYDYSVRRGIRKNEF